MCLTAGSHSTAPHSNTADAFLPVIVKWDLARGGSAGGHAPPGIELRLSVPRITVSGTLLKLSTYFKKAVFKELNPSFTKQYILT